MKEKAISKKSGITIGIIVVLLAVLCVGIFVISQGNTGQEESMLELGQRYLETLDYEQAVICFKEYLEIEPKSVEAYLGLAEAYAAMGDSEKVQEILAEGYEKTESPRIASKQDEITKELVRDIHLNLEVIDGCVAYLEWSKVNCDFYEIQMMDNDLGSWETVKIVTGAGEDERCAYVSPRLSPGAGYSFRVAAELSGDTVVSEVQECEIDITPLYCTIWPVKDLKVYSDAAKSHVVGEVKALDAYCVIDEQDDMFGINMNGSVGYIDSNYCMINQEEYLGTLCSYDIEIRSKLSLPCVNEGVTAECWMYNGFGWRYRYTDGSYATSCTLTIDGIEYTFDSDGYVQN